MAGRPSLAEFAAARPRKGRICAVCSLPQVAEINRTRVGHAAGTISAADIVAWLVDVHGVKTPPTVPSVQAHFLRGHHLHAEAQGRKAKPR